MDVTSIATGVTPYVVGLLAALGLFVSVLIHELGHAVVGRVVGVEVKHITLWLLGGIARFGRMPEQPGAEAGVAIAGPITSFVLAGLFALLYAGIPSEATALSFLALYLLVTNVVLAMFNLLPALPLDGGRVLRSTLALRMPRSKATRIAGVVSRGIAIALGLGGLLIWSPFLILIAFLIFMAVTAETQYATVTELLRDVEVNELMTRDVETVRADLPVADLVAKMVSGRFFGYPVVDESERLVGMVSIDDVRRMHDASTNGPLSQASVRDIMSEERITIPSSSSAADVFRTMAENGFHRVAVVDGSGALDGIISKTDLLRAVEARTLAREFHE
jgi:CBS domain-containing protein